MVVPERVPIDLLRFALLIEKMNSARQRVTGWVINRYVQFRSRLGT
jgi:hypothetical protein